MILKDYFILIQQNNNYSKNIFLYITIYMLEYTNLVSQAIKSYDIINSVKDMNDAKEKKAKFVPIVMYILCFISAVLIAHNYFENFEGFQKWALIALAGMFNIPFLFYYALWHIQLNNKKPGELN